MRPLFMFLLLLSSFHALAQWEQVFPLASNPIDVAVADESTAYLLCSSGIESNTIYGSRDGARTWKKITNVPVGLSRIYFIDSLTGFGIAGGEIHKTTNGATSWTSTRLSSNASVTAIQFVTRDVGFASTSGAGVFKTINGGGTWTQLTGSASKTNGYSSYPMSFFNEQIGYVVGDDKFFRTENGGTSWTELPMFQIKNIFAASENVVYLSTYYETKKSINRGTDWTLHYYSGTIPFYNPGKKGLLFNDYSDVLQADENDNKFKKVFESDFTFSWSRVSGSGNLVMGIGSDQSVVRSLDAGTSWSLINCRPQHGEFVDFHFQNDKDGFMIGPDRGLITTDNNGLSWQYDQRNLRNDIYQLAFSHPDTGILVVTNNYGMTTYDGAKTAKFDSWTPPIIGHQSSTDYEMISSKVIYSTGGQGKVFKSVNGGKNWETFSFNFSNTFYSIDCLNADVCYASGAVGKIVVTSDGGKTWTIQNDLSVNQGLVEIFALNTSVALAGGSNIILRTKDSGKTWTAITVAGGTVNTFIFTNADKGYAITDLGSVLMTTNQGEEWKVVHTQSSGSLNVRTAFIRGNSLFAITPQVLYRIPLSSLVVPTPNLEPKPEPPVVTGIDDLTDGEMIYPNPTNGPVFISMDGGVSSVQVHNMQGQVVQQYRASGSALDLTDLSPGIYIIQIRNDDKLWTGKIVKK